MAKWRPQDEDKALVLALEELGRSKPCTFNVGMLIAVPIAFAVGAFAIQRLLLAAVIPMLKALARLAWVVTAGMVMRNAMQQQAEASKQAQAEAEKKDDDDEDIKSHGKKPRTRATDDSKTAPFKKGSATIRACRGEAAKIKADHSAEAAKLSSKKERAEEDDHGGRSRAREASRRLAAQWAKDQRAEKEGAERIAVTAAKAKADDEPAKTASVKPRRSTRARKT